MSDSQYYSEKLEILKSMTWRLVRNGLAGGISAIVGLTIIIKPDFSNLKVVAYILFSAFLTGFIGAFFKGLRDIMSDGDPDALVNKIIL